MVEKESGKSVGCLNVCFPSIWMLDDQTYEAVCEVLARELNTLIRNVTHEKKKISTVLVVGLGNEMFLADSIGPRTARAVNTRSVCESSVNDDLRFKNIYSLVPNVLSNTGMDSVELVRGVVEQFHPDLVIAIDSLRTRNAERIGATVQMMSFGIRPGSGVCAHSAALNSETVGIPVLSVGMPTVVNAATMVCDAIREMDEVLQRDEDVLLERRFNFLVMPREIDLVVRHGAALIADLINRCLYFYNL